MSHPIERYCAESDKYFRKPESVLKFHFVKDMKVVPLPSTEVEDTWKRMTSPESLAMLAALDGVTAYVGNNSTGEWHLVSEGDPSVRAQ